jgi:hypothetical protein
MKRENGNGKLEKGNGNIETATPHPTLSRKGRGNDNDTAKTKALSVSGLPRATKRPRNDDPSEKRHGNGKLENGNGNIRNSDPSPCFALRNRPLPQGGRERPRKNGKRH